VVDATGCHSGQKLPPLTSASRRFWAWPELAGTPTSPGREYPGILPIASDVSAINGADIAP